MAPSSWAHEVLEVSLMKATPFALGLLLPLAALGSGGTIERVEAGQGSVSVWVYDYAHIDAETLSQAKERASKIFRRARIGLDWVDCPLGADRQAFYPGCKLGLHPVRLVVRIRAGIPPDERTRARSAFGFAYIPETGGSGFLADVYVSGADLMASGDTMQRGNMLGHLIAHELGHLLLGTTEHGRGRYHAVPIRRPRDRAGQAGRAALQYRRVRASGSKCAGAQRLQVSGHRGGASR